MESGEGENLEKCSMCLGTLARAAFFMMNRTSFIAPDEDEDEERDVTGSRSSRFHRPTAPADRGRARAFERPTGTQRAPANQKPRSGLFTFAAGQ